MPKRDIETIVDVLERASVIDAMRKHGAIQSQAERRLLQVTTWKEFRERLKAVNIECRREVETLLDAILTQYPDASDQQVCEFYGKEMQSRNPLFDALKKAFDAQLASIERP